MDKASKVFLNMPPRRVDLSAIADAHACPEEALLLLTKETVDALKTLDPSVLLEIRDLMYELGRVATNTAQPQIRVDLDLDMEPPQDWAAVVAIQGKELRQLRHPDAEKAFALGVREAAIQASGMAFARRSEMIVKWSQALGKVCEELDELAAETRHAEFGRLMRTVSERERPSGLDLPPIDEADSEDEPES